MTAWVVTSGGSSTLAGGCTPGDCITTGPSGVRLVVPDSWQLESYCVSDTCSTTPMTAAESTWRKEQYFVKVPDAERRHQYRIEVTSPDGTPFTYDGDVDVVGNSLGGESCRPQMFTAGLIIDSHGGLTSEQP